MLIQQIGNAVQQILTFFDVIATPDLGTAALFEGTSSKCATVANCRTASGCSLEQGVDNVLKLRISDDRF